MLKKSVTYADVMHGADRSGLQKMQSFSLLSGDFNAQSFSQVASTQESALPYQQERTQNGLSFAKYIEEDDVGNPLSACSVIDCNRVQPRAQFEFKAPKKEYVEKTGYEIADEFLADQKRFKRLAAIKCDKIGEKSDVVEQILSSRK